MTSYGIHKKAKRGDDTQIHSPEETVMKTLEIFSCPSNSDIFLPMTSYLFDQHDHKNSPRNSRLVTEMLLGSIIPD